MSGPIVVDSSEEAARLFGIGSPPWCAMKYHERQDALRKFVAAVREALPILGKERLLAAVESWAPKPRPFWPCKSLVRAGRKERRWHTEKK